LTSLRFELQLKEYQQIIIQLQSQLAEEQKPLNAGRMNSNDDLIRGLEEKVAALG